MTTIEILSLVGFVGAILVFLGSLAILACIAKRHTTYYESQGHSPEWERLNAIMQKDEWYDSPEYRRAFDAWADSIGLNVR